MDVEQYDPDPDKRPWVYSCDGRKVHRFENGEPDYTREYKEENNKDKKEEPYYPYYVDLP